MTTTVTPLTTADAETLIAAARRAADEAGVPVSVTVLDAGGHLLAFRRDERAVLISGETSTAKAYTALQLNAPTAEVADLVKPDGPFHSLPTALNRPLLFIGGGSTVTVSSSAPSGSAAAPPSRTTASPGPRSRRSDRHRAVRVVADRHRPGTHSADRHAQQPQHRQAPPKGPIMTAIPNVTLNNGVVMPQLGFGVFQVPDEETTAAVASALEAG